MRTNLVRAATGGARNTDPLVAPELGDCNTCHDVGNDGLHTAEWEWE